MPTSPGVFFGLLEQKQKEQVLQSVAKEAAARFEIYMKAIRTSSGLRELTGQQRLEAYRLRLPDMWGRLQARFPNEYDRQLQDWRRLETRSLRYPSRASPLSSPRYARASAEVSPAPLPQLR